MKATDYCIGCDVIGTRTTVGAARNFVDVFDAPSVVIVNPHKATSTNFKGNVARVTVAVGGTRYHPFYGDPASVGYDTPRRVDVVLAGGALKSFTKLEFASVQGGAQHLDTLVSPSRSMLRARVPVIGDGDTRPMDEYARSVEAEFQEMKKLAQEAQWPADLSSKIASIDQTWQAAKASANARKASVVRDVPVDGTLRRDMQEVTSVLHQRLTPAPPPDKSPSFFAEKYRGVPAWGWGVGGIVATAGIAVVVKVFAGSR